MVRLTGLATVTFGGGGAACFWASPQPKSNGTTPIKTTTIGALKDEDMRLGRKVMTKAGYI
jgi:hypothetical protein